MGGKNLRVHFSFQFSLFFLAEELVEKLLVAKEKKDEAFSLSDSEFEELPVPKKKREVPLKTPELPPPPTAISSSVFGMIKTDPSLIVTNEALLWKIEEENLGRLFIVLRKGKGLQYSARRVEAHTVEIIIIGSLFSEEYQMLGVKLGNIPEVMVRNWFKTWTKSILVHTRNPIASIGNLVLSIDTLEVYEFLLTQ